MRIFMHSLIVIIHSFIFFLVLSVNSLLLLAVGIEFKRIFWSEQWSWLRHLALVRGVSLHFRRLSWVEADVSTLETIADIDGSEFTILSYSHSSGPP
jgi:hypothetical protein